MFLKASWTLSKVHDICDKIMLEATGRHLSSSDEALPTTPQGAIIINQPSSNDMPSLCQTDFITHGKQARKHNK